MPGRRPMEMPQPVKGSDGWIEHYGSYHYKLARGFVLQLNRSYSQWEKGYEVKFCDRTLKEKVENLDEAKRLAIRFAAKVLGEAKVGLDALIATQR